MIVGLISWLLFGLAAGSIAKYLHPGDEPGGWLSTLGIGVLGSFLGGILTSVIGLGGGGLIWSMLTAVGGAFLLLMAQRKYLQSKENKRLE